MQSDVRCSHLVRATDSSLAPDTTVIFPGILIYLLLIALGVYINPSDDKINGALRVRFIIDGKVDWLTKRIENNQYKLINVKVSMCSAIFLAGD